jgi:pimeloyl-ACP methyl ester carboxylesterase
VVHRLVGDTWGTSPVILVGLIWIAAVSVLVVVGVGYALTIPLMRRRTPEPPDTPLLHGMLFEEVSFPSRDGLVLGGWWIPAPDTARGTVILCPGQRSSMEGDLIHAEPLHRAGFNLLMFDFRGHGRSEGNLVTLGPQEVFDLLGALDYVTQARGVERAGVMGFSMGAGVALVTAAQDNRVAALVLDGAFASLPDLLSGWARTRGLPLGGLVVRLILLIGSFRARYRLDHFRPLDVADRVTAPTLLIHGDDDPFVTVDQIEVIRARLAGPGDLWRVRFASHREAHDRHPDEYNRRVVAWFETYLAK